MPTISKDSSATTEPFFGAVFDKDGFTCYRLMPTLRSKGRGREKALLNLLRFHSSPCPSV
jgi:hypothetical protein